FLLDSPFGRTVVLCDPFPLWLEAVEKAVTAAGLSVHAKTTDVAAARSLIDEYEPDLLIAELVDGADGLDATWIRDTAARHPKLKIIVLSASSEATHREATFAAGGSAYVPKSAHSED